MGLFRGDRLLAYVRQKLGGRTFADFVLDSAEPNPRYRYKLHIIATDLSRGRMLVLPDDLPAYGLNPDDFEVAEAVRMSMSVPFFFYASRMQWRNELDRPRESVVVDGGVLSNFPVELFDSPPGRRPGRPTLGFKILDESEHKIRGPFALARTAWAMVNTACTGNDMRAIARFDRQKAVRTVRIPVSGVSAVNFGSPTNAKSSSIGRGRKRRARFSTAGISKGTSTNTGRTCGRRPSKTAGEPSRTAGDWPARRAGTAGLARKREAREAGDGGHASAGWRR